MKGPWITIVCAACGRPFETWPYNFAAKYCSAACRVIGLRNKTVVPCVQCGKPVETWPSAIRIKKIGIFCSQECYGDYTSTHQRGAAHPAFKTGASPGKYPREFARARKVVLARDGHKCRLCGSTSRLLVHHVDEDRQNNDESNLVTLCLKCHKGPVHARNEFTFDAQGNPVPLISA